MHAATPHRFETEFAPRIAQEIAELFDGHVQAEVLPAQDDDCPARVRLWGEMNEHLRHYPYALNVYLTWDDDEIDSLMGPAGPERFRHYLASLARKLQNWQDAREINFHSRSQAEPSVLIGGLDFEG